MMVGSSKHLWGFAVIGSGSREALPRTHISVSDKKEAQGAAGARAVPARTSLSIPARRMPFLV